MAQADESEGGQGQARSIYTDHNLQLVFAVTLMSVLGTASITPAFPTIEQELGVSWEQVWLLVGVFTLPGVLFTPVSGVLSDRLGRRKILIPSLILFGIAGSICALVRDFDTLLVLRTLQGIGAVPLWSLNHTIIGDLYAGRERAAAFGYNESVLSVGSMIFPAIGGALATLEWYYPFALSLVAIPIGFLALFWLRYPEPHNEQGFKEYIGIVLSPLRDRRVVGIFAGSIVAFIMLSGPLQAYLPILMDESFGASSLLIGIVLSSVALATALISTQLGRLTSYFSKKTLIRVSFLLYTVALGIIPLVPSVWLLLVPMVIFGFAQSLYLPNAFSLLNEVAPAGEDRGAFISLNSTIIRLGQTLGPVLMYVAAIQGGLSSAYFFGAAFTAAMVPVALALIR